MSFTRKWVTLGVLAGVLLTPASAQAVTYDVNTTADVVSGPGCTPSNACSLRQAVLMAGGQDDVQINLPTGNYFIDPGNDLELFNTEVTITGTDGPVTIFAPDNTGVFYVNTIGGQVDATFENLSLQHQTGDVGGGIYASVQAGNPFNLTLDHTDVMNNTAPSSAGNPGFGGGINVQGNSSAAASLTIRDSIVGNNVADGGTFGSGDGGSGAGISALNGVDVTLDDVAVSENQAKAGTHSGGRGAGMYIANSTLTIDGSTIIDNIAEGFADTSGSASIGGGVYLAGSGGNDATISNTTIARNTSQGAVGALGGGTAGGINAAAVDLDLTNVTLADNIAGSATGVSGFGGGIVWSNGGTLDIVSSTIAGNEAAGTGGQGGNFAEYGSGPFSFKNTIVSDGSALLAGENCLLNGGTPTRSGVNIESTDECGFDDGAGDLVDTDPALEALTDNEIDNQTSRGDTMAIDSDSPAFNAASGCPAPATDERGMPRPQGLVCDVGAFELEAANPQMTTGASDPVMVGGQISDQADLFGGEDPTGEITFDLYGPDDATCSGTPIFSDVVPVSDNGGYESAGFTTTAPGIYRWIARYSGDGLNNPFAGACNDPGETVLVLPPSPPVDPPSTPPSTPLPVTPPTVSIAKPVSGSDGSVTLTVTVSGPGTVTAEQQPAAGTSAKRKKKKGKPVMIKKAIVRSSKAGPVSLTLKPTPAAKKLLKKGKKVKIKTAITFSSDSGGTTTQSTTVTLQSKKKKKK